MKIQEQEYIISDILKYVSEKITNYLNSDDSYDSNDIAGSIPMEIAKIICNIEDSLVEGTKDIFNTVSIATYNFITWDSSDEEIYELTGNYTIGTTVY